MLILCFSCSGLTLFFFLCVIEFLIWLFSLYVWLTSDMASKEKHQAYLLHGGCLKYDGMISKNSLQCKSNTSLSPSSNNNIVIKMHCCPLQFHFIRLNQCQAEWKWPTSIKLTPAWDCEVLQICGIRRSAAVMLWWWRAITRPCPRWCYWLRFYKLLYYI